MSDGKLTAINTDSQLKVGDIVRMVTVENNGVFASSFSDCIISNIKLTIEGRVYQLKRPYVHLRQIKSLFGVYGVPMLNYETIDEVSHSNLVNNFRLVLSDRDQTINCLLTE